ncbi:unnamed protein product [Kuraishia capsulata CBS 1993]|uniref:TOG domain-containing protein n=1 Tax=Kuraishia capsulata CBS 1993 TaxID=1382522 RepID=W6MHD9_9ASCO|nr:uncharacterized protein KUCA_T00001355001 [Kuraishia capsulata CBS 1993]CDK25386.1 unnamed protein product [Kuraishia capsulata CBS 1993]
MSASLQPTDVSSVLHHLLSGLASSDNSIRKAAEKSLNEEWSKLDRVQLLLLFLAEQAATGPSEQIRAFAAVLFRRIAIKSPSEQGFSVTSRQIAHIDEQIKSQIRSILVHGFSSQQSNNVRHKLSDAMAEVAKEDCTPPKGWPELIPLILQAVQNQDPSFRESAFRMITATPGFIASTNLNDVLPLFHAGFVDTNDDVRIAACTAFVSFFRDLPKGQWGALSGLLPNLLNSLPKFMESGRDEALAAVLEALMELVELAPKMFKPMFGQLIEFCSTVANNKDLETSARLAGMELLVSFSEESPNMCKREPSYVETMVIMTLSLMTEVCIDDDDAADWNNSDPSDEDSGEEEHLAARHALDRICLSLGDQFLVGPLFKYIPQMIQSSNWRERQAALMGLSAAAEGCREALIDQIPKILDLILPSIQDQHSRVQYACCNAIGQISTDLADRIQRTASDRVLPALISVLTPQSVPRVQSHAAAAMVNFAENASKEALEPYLDSLLTNLLSLLKGPKRYVQEQVVTTIAIIADAAKTKFIKYYDTLMPMLVDVLQTDMGEENRMLKAKSIECSTLIALAVGKEKFAPDSQTLIQLFGHIQQNLQGEDDPVKTYLEQGWARICVIIGHDFLPYLPLVLPSLITTGEATQSISVVEEDEYDDYTQNEEYDVVEVSGKHLAVHTAVLDEKAAAIDLITRYAGVLGASFFPYVTNIAENIIIPSLSFYLHDGVREAGALAMPVLLKSVVAATSQTSNEAVAIWTKFADVLFTTMEQEPVFSLLIPYYASFVECLDILGAGALFNNQTDKFASAVSTNVSEIFERIKARENGDDEYTEDIQEDYDDYTDEDMVDEITKGLTAAFKNRRSEFLPAFQRLVPIVASCLNDEQNSLRLFGLIAVADMIEYTGANAYELKDMFMNPVGESLTSPDASIRQAAAYCVGVAAQHGGPQFRDFCLATLMSMSQMVSVPDARASDNISATENMTAAISKICHSYGSSIQGFDELAASWFKLLPVVQDDEAAPYAYMFLAELIERQHPVVMSQIPKAVEDVIQALLHSSISGKTAETVVTSTKKLLGSIPQSEAVSILTMISGQSTETKMVIQKWFS